VITNILGLNTVNIKINNSNSLKAILIKISITKTIIKLIKRKWVVKNINNKALNNLQILKLRATSTNLRIIGSIKNLNLKHIRNMTLTVTVRSTNLIEDMRGRKVHGAPFSLEKILLRLMITKRHKVLQIQGLRTCIKKLKKHFQNRQENQ